MRRLCVALALAAGLAGPARAETEPAPAATATLATNEPAVTASQAPPAAAAGEAVPTPPADAEPYALVRTLQVLQEQIAAGDVRAHAAQRGLIIHIAERLAAVDASVWQSERNARAAVLFVLSGGPPGLLRRLVAVEPKPRIDERLMRGALAYVEGNEAGAKTALAGIDPRTLPGLLGAQIALVQAALLVRDDPAGAINLLGLARLMAPGTLVEEAALRREVALEGQRGRFERFEALSIRYLRRFRQSVYAANFRQRFGGLLLGLDLERDPDKFARVEALLVHFDPEGRRELLLNLARHAVLHARPTVAQRAAARAADLSPGGSPEAERAAFYIAAARIASRDADEGAQALVALDPARLPPDDRRIFEAAVDLSVQVIEPIALPVGPVPQVDLAGARKGAAKDVKGAEGELPGSALLRRAESLLAETDALLEKARQ